MINSSSIQGQTGAESYTDFKHVNALRSLGREDKNLALEKIAEQFESMMMRMMMESMRSANKVFAEGNFLSSNETDTYRDMLDDQLALTLSKGKGIGIAEVMVRQLKGRYGEPEKTDKKEGVAIADYLNHRNIAQTVKPVPTVSLPVVADVKAPATAMTFDGSVSQFVDNLYSMAKDAARKLNVSPAVLIAQSALETGWGMKVNERSNGESSNNFFNIKADQRWNGESASVATLEVRNGVPVRERADFRAYPSAEKSFTDYADFLRSNPRYEQALKSENSESYVRRLSEAGYATDPNYAEKIMRIINSAPLQKAMTENTPQSMQNRG